MATITGKAPAPATDPVSDTSTPEVAPAPAVSGPRGVLHRLSAEDYHRMVDADIIPRDRRVELWEGLLVETRAKKQPHAVSQSKLIRVLVRNVPDGWYVAPECPITLDGDTVPLPDVTVVRGSPDDYPSRPPVAGVVGMVVEVADTSIRKDTGPSLQAYAARGIPVYWVVNIPGRRVEVYSRPTVREGVGVYESLLACGPDDAVPVVIDGREVARVPAREILPAEPAS